MSSKSEDVFNRVTEFMQTGRSQADACRLVAEETGLKYDSVRGAYQTHRRKLAGGVTNPRRRATTADDAVADAVNTLTRALESIDRECDTAATRAREYAEEAKALKATAADRKAAIQAKIDALA